MAMLRFFTRAASTAAKSTVSSRSASLTAEQLARAGKNPKYAEILSRMQQDIKSKTNVDATPIPSTELEKLFELEKQNRVHSVY